MPPFARCPVRCSKADEDPHGLLGKDGRLAECWALFKCRVVANVGGFDFQWSKEHKSLVPEQFPDANPYGVLAVAGTRWVVDAATNTIDRVRPDGQISVEAFIPNPPLSDAVPTCIDQGADAIVFTCHAGCSFEAICEAYGVPQHLTFKPKVNTDSSTFVPLKPSFNRLGRSFPACRTGQACFITQVSLDEPSGHPSPTRGAYLEG